MSENIEVYLKAIMELTARATFTPQDVAKVVCPNVNSANFLRAYNLCDGNTLQGDIAKVAGVDAGNLSKKIKHWQQEGVMLKVDKGGKEFPLHVFSISERLIPKKEKK